MLYLLNEASDSRFVIKNWDIANNQSNANYDVGNESIYNTKFLKSNLCDVYILVNGDIAITGHQVTQVAFKNCAQKIVAQNR